MGARRTRGRVVSHDESSPGSRFNRQENNDTHFVTEKGGRSDCREAPTCGIRIGQLAYRQLTICSPNSRVTRIPRTNYPFDRNLNDDKADTSRLRYTRLAMVVVRFRKTAYSSSISVQGRWN